MEKEKCTNRKKDINKLEKAGKKSKRKQERQQEGKKGKTPVTVQELDKKMKKCDISMKYSIKLSFHI